MRAIRVKEFGGPEQLQLATVPDPSPGPGQLLVRLHAIGVNPVDTYIRAGTYARKPPLPYTPGVDGAGVVTQTGPGVLHLRQAQRVYVTGSLTGTYAEIALCDASQVYPLPDCVTFAQGAAIGVPYVTAHYALFARGGGQSGQTVLIHGASGGVGIAAVQLAKAAGLTVFGTAGSEEGRALLREQKADGVFDHGAPDYLEHIVAKTAGSGVDLIIEMLANVNLAKDLTILAGRGRVAVVGSRGSIEINPRDLMSRNADVRGVMLFNAAPSELTRIHAALRAGLENGSLRPVIAREFSLPDASKAHQAVMSPGARGKIILVP
jgi:NADPH2:quinone reductase